MITLDDYKNLIEYFTYSAVPVELENFVAKLQVIYEELTYREEVQKHLQELHEKLNKLSEKDNEKHE